MEKKFFCVDCKKSVSYSAKRWCISCYDKHRFGKENSNWKGGKKQSRCIDCNKIVSFKAKRCYVCRGKAIKGTKHHLWKGGPSVCEHSFCIDCGKITTRRGGKRLTKRCCSCRGKSFLGKSNPSWRGGISREPYSFNFNKELKELIRKRDGYKCQKCGCPQKECFKKLSVHHIDYNKKNSDPKNLISLCIRCNAKVNVNRKEWTKYFQELTKIRS